MGTITRKHCDIYRNTTERTQDIHRYLITMQAIDDKGVPIAPEPDFRVAADMCNKGKVRCLNFLGTATTPPKSKPDNQ
jgi:hypothetical protein